PAAEGSGEQDFT
nr:Chain B, Syndecan-1 [Homo sapiens]